MAARSHFAIAGIPVRVEPVFFVIVLLFGYQLGELWLIVAWGLILFVSVLVHELGHAFSLRFFGQRSSIVLHAFGGVTIPRGRPARWSRGRSIIVSLAGPLAGIILLGLPALLMRDATEARLRDQIFEPGGIQESLLNTWQVLDLLVIANIIISIFNLLPVRPLDGGHVAEELFGLSAARRISLAAAGLGALYAITSTQWQFAGIFLLFLGFMNFQEIRAERGQGGVSSAFDVDAPPAPGGSRRRRSHLTAVPPQPPTTLVRDPAQVEPQVWSALRDGDADGAARIFAMADPSKPANPYLVAALALAAGQTDRAVELFDQAYVADATGPPSLVATDLLAKHGRTAAVARALLKRRDGSGREGASTLQTHLHYAEHYREAAVVGELVFAARPASPPQTAFEAACSWSRAGDVDRAVEWLERAVALGFSAPSLVDGEPDLEAVRQDPRWPVLRAQLS